MIGVPIGMAREETEAGLLSIPERRKTTTGEFLAARFGQGWDWTVARLFKEDIPLSFAGDWQRPLTRDEWEGSGWAREGIEWDDSMTAVKADVLAEIYDKRRYRESLVERYEGGWLPRALGYGAILAAQAVDPVNYLPIFGWAAKAKLLGTGVRAGMIRGALEAGVATAATEPWMIQSLASQGEDVDWTDGVMDITMGAFVGSVFGGAGAVLRGRIDKARRTAGIRTRTRAATVLEKALADVDAGEPVDVGGLMPEFMKKQVRREYGTAFLRELGEEYGEGPARTVAVEARQPDMEMPAARPEVPQTADDLLRENGYLPAEGGEPEIFRTAKRLMDEGRVRPEDAEAVVAAQKAVDKAARKESAIQQIVECVIGA